MSDEKKKLNKLYSFVSESKQVDWNVLLDYSGGEFDQIIIEDITQLFGPSDGNDAASFMLYCYAQVMPRYLNESELESVNKIYKLRYGRAKRRRQFFGFYHALWDLCDEERLTSEDSFLEPLTADQVRDLQLRKIRCQSVEQIYDHVLYCFINGYLSKLSLNKQHVLIMYMIDKYSKHLESREGM